MKILKYPKYKSSKDFRMKVKGYCICGCICQIEEFDELYYIRGFRDILDITFGYYCPSCGSVVELSDRANSKITKAIKNKGINICEYIKISNELNLRYEMGFHYDKDNETEKIYEIAMKGLPIPIHTRQEIINAPK